MRLIPALLFVLFVFLNSLCFADDKSAQDAPPPVNSDQESLEPEVRIIRRDTETVEEYRINGVLYMIKVKPDRGPEYYLIDSDGNGSLDARRSQLDPQLMIPSWAIFKW